MIYDISKTIVFRFTNRFTKANLFDIEIPYQPFLATNGKYSRLYKSMKQAAAFGFEQSLVVGKIWFEPRKTNRLIIKTDNGFKLDLPKDLTPLDREILFHHFAALKSALQG